MYLVTPTTFDSLTLKTPYPVCHVKSTQCFSRTHRDEFAFTVRTIS